MTRENEIVLVADGFDRRPVVFFLAMVMGFRVSPVNDKRGCVSQNGSL
jgi:hypothetical protein